MRRKSFPPKIAPQVIKESEQRQTSEVWSPIFKDRAFCASILNRANWQKVSYSCSEKPIIESGLCNKLRELSGAGKINLQGKKRTFPASRKTLPMEGSHLRAERKLLETSSVSTHNASE